VIQGLQLPDHTQSIAQERSSISVLKRIVSERVSRKSPRIASLRAMHFNSVARPAVSRTVRSR
jgi:hypothetical protein